MPPTDLSQPVTVARMLRQAHFWGTQGSSYKWLCRFPGRILMAGCHQPLFLPSLRPLTGLAAAEPFSWRVLSWCLLLGWPALIQGSWSVSDIIINAVRPRACACRCVGGWGWFVIGSLGNYSRLEQQERGPGEGWNPLRRPIPTSKSGWVGLSLRRLPSRPYHV